MKYANRPFRETILLAFFVTPLLATNGDLLIGVGAKTRGMGGAGIAYGHKSESALVNPALITTSPSLEMSVGGTFFFPDIETRISGMDDYAPSDSDFYVIPFVSVSKPFGEHWYVGLGMWGTAGLGTDFEGQTKLSDMQTQLMLMQVALPIAYRMNGLSLGFAPILEYGSLDISYIIGNRKIDPDTSDDVGFGWSVGMTYDFGNGLIVGAVYKSPVEMEYKGVLSGATSGALGDKLTQPEEMGVGVDYNWAEHHSIAIDYKRIGWGSVEGYEDFNWKDQDVFAVGYEYAAPEWAFRLGYNHAKSPIELSSGGLGNGEMLNMLNLLGFPATAEEHYTTGMSYTISDISSMDLAFVYAPQTTFKAPIVLNQDIAVKHSEFSFTVQYNYKY